MADFVGAVDQGTTSTRFMIFDHGGNVKGVHQLEHDQILPQAGWVEHNPAEIWERTRAVIQTALTKSNLQASDLAAVGITNQRETAVVWNKKTGRPYYNAIVWQDTRTDRIASALEREGKGDVIRQKAGPPSCNVFLGREDPVDPRKRRWRASGRGSRRSRLRQHRQLAVVESHRRCRRRRARHRPDEREPHDVDGPRDTCNGTTSCSATSTFRGRCCRRSCRRPIRGCTASRAPTARSAARVALSGDLGDQQAATVGQVCFGVGEAKNTYGTGNFLLYNTGHDVVRSKNGLLTTVCYKFGDEPTVYALEGSIAVTGSAVQWLRDQLGIIAGAAESESLAAQVPDAGGIYFVPAFSGLFAPYWRSDARGAIVGLSRFNTNAHLARATLEAICYQTRDVVEAMHQDSGVALDVLRVDGGITANKLCMQTAGRHSRRPCLEACRRRNDGARRGIRGRPRGRVLEVDRRTEEELERGPPVAAGVV